MTVSTHPKAGVSQGEILSYEEIKSRYPDQWVLLDEPERNERNELAGGKLVWHCADRQELHEKIMSLDLKHIAIRYTGEPPDDMVYAL